MHALLLSIIKYSYPGIFIALGLGILGLPIPDKMLLAFVGFLVFQGKLVYIYAVPNICCFHLCRGLLMDGYFCEPRLFFR